MNQLIKRLRLESPKFFIVVQNIGMGIVGLALGIKALAIEFQDSKILDFVLPYTTDMAVAGSIAALVAKLTVKPELPNRELK